MHKHWIYITLLILSTEGLAQNLLSNGDFDADLAGWMVTAGLPENRKQWVSDDVDSSSTSGSVEMINVGPGNNGFQRTIQQCIPVDRNANYLFSGWGKAPAVQSGNLGIFVSIIIFESSDCSGFASGFLSSSIARADGIWNPMVMTFETFDGSNSIAVAPSLGKESGTTDDVTGRVDALAVIPDTIIAADFEQSKIKRVWTE